MYKYVCKYHIFPVITGFFYDSWFGLGLGLMSKNNSLKEASGLYGQKVSRKHIFITRWLEIVSRISCFFGIAKMQIVYVDN